MKSRAGDTTKVFNEASEKLRVISSLTNCMDNRAQFQIYVFKIFLSHVKSILTYLRSH